MNQDFSAEELIKLCKKSELVDHGYTRETLLIELKEAFEKITKGTYEFNLSKFKAFFSTTDLVDKLVIRKLNDNIKRLYKDKQANRRMIIYQIMTLLEDECPIWIYRSDIMSFYGSINRNRLIEKFKGDSILSYFSIRMLEKMFNHPLIASTEGLPQGISISATLSEIYMRPFDKWVRAQTEIYYYSRFVDDIVMFGFKEKTMIDLEAKIDKYLPSGLKRNLGKSKSYNGRRISIRKPMEFLGYKFYRERDLNADEKLVVSIATEKKKKIKTRMVLCFIDYLKNNDATLLEDRIKFLTGNYTIKSNIDGNDLKAGIYFNYTYVNDGNVFKELNLFYYKMLNARNYSLGKRLSIILSAGLKSRLSKYSFKHGFQNKVHHKFSPVRMKTINRCWQ